MRIVLALLFLGGFATGALAQTIKSGDSLVIVSDVLAGEHLFDSIQLRTVA